MKKSDLKAGYAVVTRDGHVGIILPTSVNLLTDKANLSVAYFDPSYRKGWDPIELYRENLHWGEGECGNDIAKVYGYPFDTARIMDPEYTISCRDLLWERTEAKKMTVAEVCKALGYDVEIVKDGDSK